MKKLLSFVLSLCLCVSLIPSVTAAAAPEISVSLLTFSVNVSVTSEENLGKLTMQIADKADNTATVLAGMAETKTYTKTEDGKYQYDVTFTMQPTHPSGTYFVRLGAKGGVYTKEFTFINAQEKVDFFNALDKATASENGIYNLLTGENSKATYDLTAYKALSAEVRLLVDAEIETLALACTSETIETAETALYQLLDDAVVRAQIADAKDTTVWETAVNTAIENEMFDGTYATKTTPKTVMGFFEADSIKQEDLKKSYDKAQLLACADELDYNSLKDAFSYYYKKGILNIDDETYEAVVKNGLESNLFRALKEKNNTDIETLEDNVDSIAEDLLKEDDEEVTTRPTGGGGGVGGGGRPSSGNTNSNPSSGVMANGDAKPDTQKPTTTISFSDLHTASWAKEAILALAAKGVVAGRGDGNFYPNDTVTREEFVKMIVLAFDVEDANATASFKDVAEDRWSYQYIASASRLGLVLGDENGYFNPTGTITRQDMAVILYRVYDMAGLKGEAGMEFTDEWQIAAYARQAVGVLYKENIVNGMGDGTFAPLGKVTRAQASKVIYELLTLIGGDK